MSEFVEVILNAETGELTERPFTNDEIAAVMAKRSAAVVTSRAEMRLSFAQLLIGLVAEGWISEVDGDAWADGYLPAAVQALIATLPAEQWFAARTRAKRPSEVLRLDPLVNLLASGMGKTDTELDTFFTTYAKV